MPPRPPPHCVAASGLRRPALFLFEDLHWSLLFAENAIARGADAEASEAVAAALAALESSRALAASRGDVLSSLAASVELVQASRKTPFEGPALRALEADVAGFEGAAAFPKLDEARALLAAIAFSE